MSPRTGSICDGALRTLGALASLGVLFAALHDTSLAWDGWYYHLPFAARLVGLIPADAYVFHPANQARYAGFALLAELLQGVLWRITGRAESANLVAFASVPLVAWFLQRRWQVPFTLTLLALFAVPLVQAHAPSTYVDLPGNAAASVLVLLLVHAYASESPPSARDVVLALLAGAIAANIKPLLQPIVGLGLLAMLARLVQSARDAPSRHRAKQLAALMVLAAPLVLFTPLKNAALHHNPFYPIGVDILGVHLPGPEAPYASSPPWLAAAPRPLRFVSSLLEIGVRPLSDPRRWTVDQWMPDDSMGNRMGGFFGAYVVLLLLALGYRVARDNTRLARVSGVTFGVFTVLVACMPQSHELRYYLSWMIVLVSLNLLLAARPGAPRFALGLRGLGTIAAGAFLVVLASDARRVCLSRGLRVVDLVRARVDPTVIDGIAEGEHVCVRGEPFSLLWADRFHPPHHYVVQEAEALEDCRGLREVGAR